ncbi:MAG: hypothetical protein R6V19_05530 [Armatimonadota bacterium]
MAEAWYEQQLCLRQQMERWIYREMNNQEDEPWHGGHDEGTFAASWIEYYRMTHDEEVLDFLTDLQDSFLDWADENFVDGYWPEQEAHHGPEAFMIFLARMWHLNPDNDRIVEAFEDAAEHIGNWADDVPDWYDWENHRFVSWSLGTEVVGDDEAENYNVADHFKVSQLALVTYIATDNERYLEVVQDFADRWVEDILDGDTIPAAFVPIDDRDEIEDTYSEAFVENLDLSTEDALERHAAAGSIDTLMDLYELTGEDRYAETVAVMLQAMMGQVADAYADPAAPLFGRYRMVTGDSQFDKDLQKALSVPKVYEDYFMMFDDKPSPHPMGLGRRKDAPKWGHWGSEATLELTNGPSPAALMLLYQLTGDETAATRAFQLAATRLKLALDTGLESGRHHGCSGNTINAIAFGHGRSAGAGYAMTTLYPGTLGNRRFVNGEKPLLQYWNEDEAPGLPEEIEALCRRVSLGEASLTLASTSFQPTTVIVGPAQKDQELTVSAGGRELQQDEDGRTPIQLPLGQEYGVDITIE